LPILGVSSGDFTIAMDDKNILGVAFLRRA